MDQDQAKKAVIATFPAEFGLRGYPGEKFRIGLGMHLLMHAKKHGVDIEELFNPGCRRP